MMAVLLFAGFAFAALAKANPLWASVSLDITILSVAVAFAIAFAQADVPRLLWLGFAITCGLRFAFGLWQLQLQHMSLDATGKIPLSLLLELRRHLIQRPIGMPPPVQVLATCHSLEAVFLGLVAAIVCRFLTRG
jgi:hypothetical protein